MDTTFLLTTRIKVKVRHCVMRMLTSIWGQWILCKFLPIGAQLPVPLLSDTYNGYCTGQCAAVILTPMTSGPHDHRPVKVLTDDSQAGSFSHPRLSGYHEDKPTSSLALIPVRRQAVQHFASELLHFNQLPRANCNVIISISSMHNASTFEKHGPHVWIMKKLHKCNALYRGN